VKLAELGDFTTLKRTLEELVNEDFRYSTFCSEMKKIAVQFDDEGIMQYTTKYL